MRFVIVTGMSGAGKSTALKMLEDMGYFCVDNLPIPLLPRFVEMFSEPDEEVKKNLVLDLFDIHLIKNIFQSSEILSSSDINPERNLFHFFVRFRAC